MFGIVPKIQTRVCALNFWPNSVRKLLMSETGPFTCFFWGPYIKLCIIANNVNDFVKPVDMISSKL